MRDSRMNNKKILFIHPNNYSGGAQAMINIFSCLKGSSDFKCYMMFVGKSDYIQKLLDPSEDIIYHKQNLFSPMFIARLSYFIIKNLIIERMSLKKIESIY